MNKILYFLLTPYRRWKERQQFKKRLEELRKRDPFIYK
jgi:hypothetical protein